MKNVMTEKIKSFMEILTMHKKSTGMTFIRKFGRSPIPGKTIVVFLTMMAVPDEEAALIPSELHSPTLGSCSSAEDVVAIFVSTGEGKDISGQTNTGSKGATFDGLVRQPIWRF